MDEQGLKDGQTGSGDPLVDLGFTPLEAELYGLLLEEPGATGYRLAQRLRKPAPNVYKAIESLESKGAVMVVDGKHRHCSAVPPDELLGHLERRFLASKQKAAKALAERTRPPMDDRVYQLRSSSAVFEKARSMLRGAEDVVLFDGFPGMVKVLEGELKAVAERGASVGALLYEPLEIDGEPPLGAGAGFVEGTLDPRRQATLERWPGQWLVLVVDAKEMLLAFLSDDLSGVHQAIWSRSPYLVWVHHGGASSELILSAVENLVAEGADLQVIQETMNRLGRLKAYESPGYRRLRETLERDETSGADSSLRAPPTSAQSQ